MIKRIANTIILAMMLSACMSMEPRAPLVPLMPEEFSQRLSMLPESPGVMDQAFFNYLSAQATREDRQAVERQLPAINWYGNSYTRRKIQAIYPSYYHRFLQRETVTLFIKVNRDRELSSAIRAELLSNLAPHVRLTDKPYLADMKLTYNEQYSDTDTTEKERKPKDKGYSGKYRKDKIPQCQRLIRGHFTEVKYKLETSYSYRMTFSIGGTLVEDRTYDDRSSVDYKVGQDLRAETPCGTKPTNLFPNDGVRRQFDERLQKQKAHVKLTERIARDLAWRAKSLGYPLRSELY